MLSPKSQPSSICFFAFTFLFIFIFFFLQLLYLSFHKTKTHACLLCLFLRLISSHPMTISSMGFSCDNDSYDKTEAQFEFSDSTWKYGTGTSTSTSTGVLLLHGVVPMETQTEFKPIDHPLEPTDDDRPIQCPMPHSSLLNDGEMRNGLFAERLWKSAELPLGVDEDGMVIATSEPPTRAVRKRHHTLTSDHTVPPLLRSTSLPPAPPNQNTTICRALRQL